MDYNLSEQFSKFNFEMKLPSLLKCLFSRIQYVIWKFPGNLMFVLTLHLFLLVNIHTSATASTDVFVLNRRIQYVMLFV